MAKREGEKGRNLLKSWAESFFASRPFITRAVGRIVQPDEVEDILQETFVLSYAAARKQQIRNPGAFMMRTARNLALNHVGSADQRYNSSLFDLDENQLARLHGSVEEEHQSNEKFLIFCKAVAGLPPACRRVFILRKVYGFSQKEVASYLDISPSTVEKHVANGMLLTAQYMSNNGFSMGGRNSPAPGRPNKKEKVHGE